MSQSKSKHFSAYTSTAVALTRRLQPRFCRSLAAAAIAFAAEGDAIFVIGDNNGHLGQSLWLRTLHGREAGDAPPVNLAQERERGEFVRRLIGEGLVSAVHDVSDGGLLVALAEMALAGNIGCSLEQVGDHFTAFGEDQGRYLVTTRQADRIQAAGIPMHRIGTGGGDSVAGGPLSELRAAHESFFREWMEG